MRRGSCSGDVLSEMDRGIIIRMLLQKVMLVLDNYKKERSRHYVIVHILTLAQDIRLYVFLLVIK